MKRLSKSERWVGLVLAALLAGACDLNPASFQAAPSPRWASQCTVPAPGCLYLENHDTAPVYIVRAGEKPGPANLVPPRIGSVPGRSHMVIDPAHDAGAVFTVVSDEVALAGTVCSFGVEAWARRNPALAWRDGALRCEGGR